jgi:cysteine-rich repeat protein
VQADGTRCAIAPDFGHGALAPAAGAASAETIDLLRQLHVVLPPAAPASTPACLEAVDDWAEKLLQTKVKAFVRCKKAGLAAGTVSSAETLSACLDAAKSVANTKIAKLVSAAGKAAAKSCPYSSYLRACSDQSPAGIAACMDRVADCRACKLAGGIDGTTTDCDTFDDGAANDSCPDACGNGAVGSGLPEWQAEACDDANFINGDGCDYNCTVSGCGNGVVAAGEFCDQTRGRCAGGVLDGAPCERNEQCEGGICTSCPPGGCSNDCSACGAGICCDTSIRLLVLVRRPELLRSSRNARGLRQPWLSVLRDVLQELVPGLGRLSQRSQRARELHELGRPFRTVQRMHALLRVRRVLHVVGSVRLRRVRRHARRLLAVLDAVRAGARARLRVDGQILGAMIRRRVA